MRARSDISRVAGGDGSGRTSIIRVACAQLAARGMAAGTDVILGRHPKTYSGLVAVPSELAIGR
jgi:thymidylate kinase